MKKEEPEFECEGCQHTWSEDAVSKYECSNCGGDPVCEECIRWTCGYEDTICEACTDELYKCDKCEFYIPHDDEVYGGTELGDPRYCEDCYEEEEEEETWWGEFDDKGICMVAGGGMANGNAYANIELKNGKYYYYCEYGKNPTEKFLGTKLVWVEKKSLTEGSFKILIEYADDTPCDPPCKTHPMLGRSWWKNRGYGGPCGCAVKAHNEYYPDDKILKW